MAIVVAEIKYFFSKNRSQDLEINDLLIEIMVSGQFHKVGNISKNILYSLQFLIVCSIDMIELRHNPILDGPISLAIPTT